MRFASIKIFAVLLLSASLIAGTAADARAFQSLYQFQGGADGDASVDKLLLDNSGNLYGVTTANDDVLGTVFKLAPDGTETVLYAFQYVSQQASVPTGGVVMDAQGNLYGEAKNGGAYRCPEISTANPDCGSVFKLAPNGTMTTIVSFQGGADGGGPLGGLSIDSAGNLYGTTKYDGASGGCGGVGGCGTVFKIASDGTKTVLYSFTGHSDGAKPTGSLTLDGLGNLYGTTTLGGLGQGTVFNLAPDSTETVLHAFDGSDGSQPTSGLVLDASGNLYGTTPTGSGSGNAYGEVYELAPAGTLTVLYAFTNAGGDGVYPNGGMAMDKKGNLYGSTISGGKGCKSSGCGTVFQIAKNRAYKQIAQFKGSTAHNPLSGVVVDSAGNVYGSAFGPFKDPNQLGILFAVQK